jgi:deoxyadenosine/deoxycytidine kinase
VSNPDRLLKVGVVGPCAAGKSTLVAALKAAGYEARHVAQEHSHVLDMWQRLTRPDVLVYLDVQYEMVCQRRIVTWGPEWMDTQRERLAHARAHCDLYLATDDLTAEEVRTKVLAFLEARRGAATR